MGSEKLATATQRCKRPHLVDVAGSGDICRFAQSGVENTIQAKFVGHGAIVGQRLCSVHRPMNQNLKGKVEGALIDETESESRRKHGYKPSFLA